MFQHAVAFFPAATEQRNLPPLSILKVKFIINHEDRDLFIVVSMLYVVSEWYKSACTPHSLYVDRESEHDKFHYGTEVANMVMKGCICEVVILIMIPAKLIWLKKNTDNNVFH